MLFDGDQHVLETAEHVRTDRVAFERARVAATGPLSTETAKWFAQKCTRRSTNGAGVFSALFIRATTALRYVSLPSRRIDCSVARFVAGSLAVIALRALAKRVASATASAAGPRGRPRVVTVELRDERRLRVRRRRLVGPCAETETVQRDGGRCDVVRVVHDTALAMRTRV